MVRGEKKVVGYFAYGKPTEIICSGEACIIAGSRGAMEQYVAEVVPGQVQRHTIKKTTFGEIKQGLMLGGAYGFDEGAYKRFYPLAKQAGLGVSKADFAAVRAKGERYLIVQLARLG